MKFLVTGGAGFIGSHIVERLLLNGHDVNIIDNFSTGKIENISHMLSDIKLHEGDIRDYPLVYSVMQNVDYVLHQAALSSVPQSIDDPILTNDINVNGTLNILEASRSLKIKKVVIASSAAVYGDDPRLPKSEEMYPEPLSPYAASKYMGEVYSKIYSDLYGVGVVNLRYFNVFGPRQDPNSGYAAVIPKFITSMLNDKQPVIYGDGLQSRDFIYVDDIVEANINAALSDSVSGVAINCASGNKISVNDLAHLINKILLKNLKPVYKEVRKGDIKFSYADVSLIKQLLDFKATVSMEEGLIKTIKSYQ